MTIEEIEKYYKDNGIRKSIREYWKPETDIWTLEGNELKKDIEKYFSKESK